MLGIGGYRVVGNIPKFWLLLTRAGTAPALSTTYPASVGWGKILGVTQPADPN